MLHVAVTAVGAGARSRDVVIRAGAHRLVAELADDLAAYLGLARQDSHYAVVVERTGEQLVSERRLDQVDLREGDTLRLLPPGETATSHAPRRRLRRLAEV